MGQAHSQDGRENPAREQQPQRATVPASKEAGKSGCGSREGLGRHWGQGTVPGGFPEEGLKGWGGVGIPQKGTCKSTGI